MSILRPVIRACAVAALRNMTWAQTNVYDSDLTPLADALQGKAAAPYIVVYTDADDIPQVRGVAEIYDGDSRRLQLVMEIGVASSVKGSAPGFGSRLTLTDVVFTAGSNEIQVPSTNGISAGMAVSVEPGLISGAWVGVVAPPTSVTLVDPSGNPMAPTVSSVATATFSPPLVNIVQFAHTDFGTELAVDITCAQAMAALIGDPYQPWGQLFKRFAYKLYRVQTRRGGAATGGVRFAARRIVLHFSTYYDLSPGIVPSDEHPIWDFFNLAKSNPLPGPAGTGTITDMAATLNKVVTAESFPDWRQAQSLLGLTKHAVKLLHVPGSPLPLETEVPPTPPADTDEFAPPLNDIKLDDSTTDPRGDPFTPDTVIYTTGDYVESQG